MASARLTTARWRASWTANSAICRWLAQDTSEHRPWSAPARFHLHYLLIHACTRMSCCRLDPSHWTLDYPATSDSPRSGDGVTFRNKLTPRFCESHASWRLRWRPSRVGDCMKVPAAADPETASGSRCSGMMMIRRAGPWQVMAASSKRTPAGTKWCVKPFLEHRAGRLLVSGHQNGGSPCSDCSSELLRLQS